MAAAGMSIAVLGYAPAASAGLGVLTVGLILWINWGRPWWRKRRMRRPFAAYFGSGARSEWARELRVPAHAEIDIQLWLEPRLHYTQHEIVFGFDGLPGDRPEPLRVHNSSIKVGLAKYQTPREDPGHYIDEKDAYHIRSTAERTPGNTYTLGFIVKTNSPGRYSVVLYVISDVGESRPTKPLFLVVGN